MVTVLTVITQMLIMKKQHFVEIRFNVNGIGLNKQMTRKVKGIAAAISQILGVHQSAIVIERAHDLSSGGFRFVIEVDVNMDEKVNHQQLMQKAIDRGALAEIFKKYWKLQQVPVFTELDCKMIGVESEIGLADVVDAGNSSKAAVVEVTSEL